MALLTMAGGYPFSAYAQQEVLPEDIGFTVSPQNPAPMDEVEIRLKSFSTNINTAHIGWFVNGRSVQVGTGMTSYTFTMGASGSVYDIEIRIRPNLLTEIVKKIRLTPFSVDLLWEAPESYTPPFYRGKALPGSESNIHVVAVPQTISSQNPQRFVYAWKNNGETDQDASGFNKRDFLVQNDFFSNRFVVDTEMVSQGGQVTIEKSLTVPRFDPRILFEVRQPSSIAKLSHADTPTTINNDLNVLIAHPFFFSTRDGEEGLSYEWSINGERYYGDTTSLPKNYVPLVPAQGQSGSATIAVTARHGIRTLQNVQAKHTVFFKN